MKRFHHFTAGHHLRLSSAWKSASELRPRPFPGLLGLTPPPSPAQHVEGAHICFKNHYLWENQQQKTEPEICRHTKLGLHFSYTATFTDEKEC